MIDTHCHLIDPQFKRDFDRVLERARSAGINIIINIGYDIKTSILAIEMNKNHEWILPAIGIHPNETADELIPQVIQIDRLCEDNKITAIGETGLDFYRNFSPREAQQVLFRQHINIARKHNLPLIIHTRNAIDEAIRILTEEDYHRGIFHCYSGTYEQARKIIDLGFYLGFGGTLTFSQKVREVFKQVPIDTIVFETDAPFLAPIGHRGQRNEPAFIVEIVNLAASLIGIGAAEIARATDRNAQRLFSLSI